MWDQGLGILVVRSRKSELPRSIYSVKSSGGLFVESGGWATCAKNEGLEA